MIKLIYVFNVGLSSFDYIFHVVQIKQKLEHTNGTKSKCSRKTIKYFNLTQQRSCIAHTEQKH